MPFKYAEKAPEKGYALYLTVLLIILLGITSYVLVVSLDHNVRTVRQEVEYNRAYYAAIASMEYGAKLLQYVDEIHWISKLDYTTGDDSWTVSSDPKAGNEGDGTEFGEDFFEHIGVRDNNMLDVDIIITNISKNEAKNSDDEYFTFEDDYYRVDVRAYYF